MRYRLIRSRKRKKTLSLKIDREGEVIIQAPYKTPLKEIDGFFREKIVWVEKKLAEHRAHKAKTNKIRGFEDGEGFFYLGYSYPLLFKDGKGFNGVRLVNGNFIIHRDFRDNAERFFVEWYKKTARELFQERADYYSKTLKLYPSGIKITSGLYRYGSCSGRDSISLSWRLIMAPLQIIDYVIVHELCHIKEKNHSYRFWNLMESIIPDYKERKKWLKDNRHLFIL
ncbi:MAG: M48 family metallopeptidase [Syntrophorhabdaceae bacterium]|nr:M48 family metallopeptidase [Syntrophorhabdaceae bacterium]